MNILNRAVIFATQAHSGACRKGTKIPYIVHPLESLSIAATMTVDEEILAAAVLHDVIEDTPVTKEQLEKEFGNRVCKLVCADSENKQEEKPAAETWESRKQATLDNLSKASKEEQIIVLADKLSNIRAIYRDYADLGDELWNRFNVKEKSKHAWYYLGVAERLTKVCNTHAFCEYKELVSKVFSI